VRPRLLAWQWSDYTAKHRDRGNLLLHVVAVPLFQLGGLALIFAIVTRRWGAAAMAVTSSPASSSSSG
jgi:uncharacterized membrane protein YGL010W